MEKATTLQELAAVCHPGPLESAEELEAFYVDVDRARSEFLDTREQIYQSLKAREDARILFYGHGGCGKSTELNKFLEERGNEFFPVKFSVRKEMPLVNIRPEDLVFTITERVLNEAREHNLPVSNDLLQPIDDYFAEVTQKTTSAGSAEVQVGAGVDSSGSLLGKVLGVFAKVRSDIKLRTAREDTAIAYLRKRPVDLLLHANNVLSAVRQVVPQDKRLLVVVEELDKLDLANARRIFVENASLLSGLITNAVYTIPVFLFHSPEVSSFLPLFDDAIQLPMIKVTDATGVRMPGFDLVRDIVKERVAQGLITDKALDLLVKKTAGVLRHVFQVLHTCSTFSDIAPPLTEEHIRSGLDRLRNDLWLQIALPYEDVPHTPPSVQNLYGRLVEHAKEQRQGKHPIPISDVTNQILLQSVSLVQYDGDMWVGVHPLVVENLQRKGLLEPSE